MHYNNTFMAESVDNLRGYSNQDKCKIWHCVNIYKDILCLKVHDKQIKMAERAMLNRGESATERDRLTFSPLFNSASGLKNRFATKCIRFS